MKMNAIAIISYFVTPEQKTIFTSGAILAIFRNVLAKSDTSRGKLNNLLVANTSTPIFNRAFFVCSTRIPQVRLERQSMVACYGQRLVVGCLPQVAVFHPVTRYRQAVESIAVTLKSLSCGVTQMIFKFLCLDREAPNNTYQTAILTLDALNEDEARWQLSSRWKLLLDRPIARFSTKGGNA